jgi:hypothetical protein
MASGEAAVPAGSGISKTTIAIISVLVLLGAAIVGYFVLEDYIAQRNEELASAQESTNGESTIDHCDGQIGECTVDITMTKIGAGLLYCEKMQNQPMIQQ